MSSAVPAAQHRAVVGGADEYPAGLARPEPGPIAILPDPRGDLADAVRAGGGDVAPLSPATRGVIWLSPTRADELATILDSHPAIGWVQL
ncbi:MAG TPA: hydroxyacid dehydrogenase, partial [Pseudolysinimonas sp.]|nr:hydroxyacid dehydrogenase [Pseudolysinimonas sp.]